MSTMSLGTLTEVDLREAWAHEATAFTPWLAQAENLELLGDELDLDLEFEASELNVGPFRADILCKASGLGEQLVLIENQLEPTNHSHLGQLLTYAAGLDAVTIVWIASRFTDEHRAALDWLNDITDERARFFGLEIKLYRIGESELAPKFDVVSKPNDWTKSAHSAARAVVKGDLSPTQEMQLRFWTKLRELQLAEPGIVRAVSAKPYNYLDFSVGRSGFGMSATMNTQKSFIRTNLICYGDLAWEHHDALLVQRSEIEQELGFKLEWPESRENKQPMISRTIQSDPTDESKWDEQVRWLRDSMVHLRRVFEPRIKSISVQPVVIEQD